MAKPLSFKDMMSVQHRPGEDELTNYRANKRRRGQGAGADSEYSSTNPPRKEETENEALNVTQRMARRRLMKRIKSRIKLGRDKAARRMASKDTLEKRAQRQARKALFKKLVKGKDKNDLPFSRRQEIEKKLDKPAMKKRISMLAKRMVKDVRKKEVERKKG